MKEVQVDKFLFFLKVELNYSELTIKSYQLDLTDFFGYIESKKINYLTITNHDVRGYLKYLDSCNLKTLKDQGETRTSTGVPINDAMKKLQGQMLLNRANSMNKNTNEFGVLEIKTCTINQYNKNKWTNTIPINYYCQVLHYLMVTQYSFAFVYALLKHQNYIEIKKYNILKNEVREEIDYIRQKEIEFWIEYVEKDIEPNLLINI